MMKNAFSVFVFGKYELYLPYYVYTIEKSYPNTDVVVFYNGVISDDIKKYLNTKKFVRIYENFYKEYNYFNEYRMLGGGGLTLLRYLIPELYFENYDKVYFGDVDVLILRDSINLFEFHNKQADRLKLPFSNRVRKLDQGGISKRLTGLHFIMTKPYYSIINPIILKILNNREYREKFIDQIKRDEEFLYSLNMEVFNFNPVELSENKSPLHGFHLGVFRNFKEIHPNEIRDNSLLSYEEIKIQLIELVNQNEFNFIIRTFFVPEMIKTLMFFNLEVAATLKIKYFYLKYYDKSFLQNIVKKINYMFKSGKQ